MAGGGSARDLARQGLGGPGGDPKDPPAQRLTVGRGGAVLSTKSRSSRENRSGCSACGKCPALSKTPGCPGAVVRLDRVRHRDDPVAPATTVAAPVLVFATGPPTPQPADPLPRRGRALPVTPRSRHPLRTDHGVEGYAVD